MKIYRANAWTTENGETFLSEEGRYNVGAPPAIVSSYKLLGSDEKTTTIDVFQFIDAREAVALITPDSPDWAEDAVARLFQDDGNKRAAKWTEVQS